MSDDTIRKPDKDFSKEVDTQLPETEELAKVYLNIEYVIFNHTDKYRFADECTECDREAYGLGKANKTGEPHILINLFSTNLFNRLRILRRHLELSSQ